MEISKSSSCIYHLKQCCVQLAAAMQLRSGELGEISLGAAKLISTVVLGKRRKEKRRCSLMVGITHVKKNK